MTTTVLLTGFHLASRAAPVQEGGPARPAEKEPDKVVLDEIEKKGLLRHAAALTARVEALEARLNAAEAQRLKDVQKLEKDKATKSEVLRLQSWSVPIRTGPDNGVGPEHRSRLRATTTTQDYSVGKVKGEVVAVWVDWPHHTMEKSRYSHVIPTSKGGDVTLKMRAIDDATVSIATIVVHVLYREQ